MKDVVFIGIRLVWVMYKIDPILLDLVARNEEYFIQELKRRLGAYSSVDARVLEEIKRELDALRREVTELKKREMKTHITRVETSSAPVVVELSGGEESDFVKSLEANPWVQIIRGKYTGEGGGNG